MCYTNLLLALTFTYTEIIVKKLSSLQRHSPTRRSKTANVTKEDITLQHIAKMSLCCEVISSFVIFAVLNLRVGGCCP